ncbi:MAG: NAD(P)/FAD-dependent oxidoreductase [candidate division Zixibacteria bacterium]|nr:NAD(P)/FAD-dependent oxidoreductase [candidate division Zixibacteria bacterium]
MSGKDFERRDFIKSLLAGFSMIALDWSLFPRGAKATPEENQFDAVILGAGLGGLSCAAAFARQGFKTLVLEKHDKAGGYATTFPRPGGFVFDVSLHSTTVGERNGIHNLIPGFPEIAEVEFVPHPVLYRVIYPDYDIRVPQKDLKRYIEILTGYFPEEKEGIQGLIDDTKGVLNDINRILSSRGQVDMSRFPVDFPHLFRSSNQTWGQMQDARIKNPRLKAILSSLWGYFGLPPSKLASYYYALPVIGYLEEGGYYPVGKSQKISDAFVKFIQQNGGKTMLKTKVEKILVKDHAAYGVRTSEGKEFFGKVIVSNANAYDTFHKMLDEKDYLIEYLSRLEQLSVSLSCFQVFLGLKKDLVGELGITDTEIFYETGYDHEESYQTLLNAEIENSGFGVTLYDNLYKGYSPEGKNTINILSLQGYDHWKKYEDDYLKGNKAEYRKEKERMADILIKQVEKNLLPGLSKCIEVKEIGTPLTNLRYTGNYRGAIYGWDQTLDNSGMARLPHNTPIKNLYLSGAWTRPGHGYGGVIWSGLECFGEIMKSW